MHNFGRGMWRRVGDYERIQRNIIQQSSFEQFIKYQVPLNAQQQEREQEKPQKQQNIKQSNTIIADKVNIKNNINEQTNLTYTSNNYEPNYETNYYDETRSNEHIEYY